MKAQTPFKIKVTLLLLLVAIILEGIALFMLMNIDPIVHRDLYQYGLQFDYAWANQYWYQFNLFTILLIASTAAIAISIIVAIILIKRKRGILKLVAFTFIIIATVLTIISIQIFKNIDYIIHTELYNYGLQFSQNWAAPYYTLAYSLLASIGVTSIITITSPLIMHSELRKKEEKPRISIKASEPLSTEIEIKKSKEAQTRIKTTKNLQLKLTFPFLITIGAICLLSSVFYDSNIIAFIGLGFLFWGILFAYLRTEEYTKKALLDAIARSHTTTLNQIINNMSYKGNAVYMPPKYFTNPENIKAYIPKQTTTLIPAPEQIQKQETETILTDPDGMLITPIGAELTKLFEKTLDINFAMVDLKYLQQNLPSLLIEELEVLKNFELETENQKITIKIAESTNNRQSQNPLTDILASAFACALAKATGNPITIEKQETNSESGETTIEYRIITEEA